MMKCTAIIPYYQKKSGVLRRALQSVFTQTHADFDVIVVDDASPSPVEPELEAFSADRRTRITVIRQPNAGPGGARNTGLDHVPADSSYVAFLDSDDQWNADHLETAIRGTSLFDADCYFASIEGGEAVSYHVGVAALADKRPPKRLSQDPPLIEIADLAGAMLRNHSVLHLSCMVLGERLFRTTRFDPRLRLAGEDVLFFYDCVRGAKRTILNEATGAVRGHGINIFHSLDNDSPLYLKQQFNKWIALNSLARRVVDSPADRASIEAHKQAARRLAIWGQMRLLRRRKMPQFGQLAEWASRDPKILWCATQLAVDKLTK